MATTSRVSTAKRQLRSTIKKALASLSTDEISSQSQKCIHEFLSLPEYQSSKRISIFLSIFGREIDTSGAVEHALTLEKKLYVPYIHKNPSALQNIPNPGSASSPPSLMDMLSVESLADYHSLKPDPWGIPSIPRHSLSDRQNCLEDEGLDLIVVPGVAFDEGFSRLGHGKGYYDYFLARYKLIAEEKIPGMRMPILVALALKEQFFGDGTVPVDLSDWPMDIIIVGDGKLFRR